VVHLVVGTEQRHDRVDDNQLDAPGLLHKHLRQRLEQLVLVL
jgi:hypothetical protein